jgi:PadR family transcriptional regulator PadR
MAMGKFELALMAAILRLRDNAYGRSLHAELEKRLARSVPTGQIYVALGRLEQKGYISSEVGAPTPVRGGRAKTFYSLTGAGEVAFQSEREGFDNLFAGAPLAQEA